VVVFTDPDLTAREFDALRADTAHKWMYPINSPEA
jgi:serine/threonine protein kinase HipA of HipAB toxin-antitoxin module